MPATQPSQSKPEDPFTELYFANPAIWAIVLLPGVFLGMTAIFLIAMWDRLPGRWVIHWGASGQPDGWATKTPFWVFFPIGFGFGLWLLINTMGWITGTLLRKHKTLPVDAAAELAVANMVLIHTLAAGLASVFIILAVWLPLGRPDNPTGMILVIVGILALAMVGGIRRLGTVIRSLHQRKIPGLEGYTGVLYRNPNDPRLWVPKLSGLGYTINFAHPKGWLVFLAMIGIPLLIVLGTILLLASAR